MGIIAVSNSRKPRYLHSYLKVLNGFGFGTGTETFAKSEPEPQKITTVRFHSTAKKGGLEDQIQPRCYFV
jgi:hypothetical protein